MNINKCIFTWIHEKNFDTQYVIYVLNYIQKNKSKLNSVYGVIYYLNNTNLINDYKSMLRYEKYKETIKKEFGIDSKETEFTYKSKNGIGWCEIL